VAWFGTGPVWGIVAGGAVLVMKAECLMQSGVMLRKPGKPFDFLNSLWFLLL
jgi:hypothetical protein